MTRCSICLRPDRAAIDAALVSDARLQEVAAAFGISRFIIGRHQKHVIELRGRPEEMKRGSDVASIIEQVLELEERTAGLLAKAERAGDRKMMLAAIDRQMALIEFRAKLAGVIKTQKGGGPGGKFATTEGTHGLDQLIDRSRLFDVKPGRANATLPASDLE
jgi:hypothetical protein